MKLAIFYSGSEVFSEYHSNFIFTNRNVCQSSVDCKNCSVSWPYCTTGWPYKNVPVKKVLGNQVIKCNYWTWSPSLVGTFLLDQPIGLYAFWFRAVNDFMVCGCSWL
jgi:hypothetical protein